MSNLTQDQRKQRLASVVKWGLGLVGAAIVAPVVFLAVQGLVGLVLAGVLGLAIVHGAPVLSMKFANWKLKGIKSEAQANPIETRQNVALTRHARLADVAKGIEAFGAEVRNVADQVRELRRNGQGADADELDAELVQLQLDFEDQLAALNEAKTALALYEDETVRLSRRWKAALALLKAKGASGKDVTKELEKLVSQEATDAVNSKMNQAFASLDVDRASRRRQLQNNPSPIIDVTAVENRERVGL